MDVSVCKNIGYPSVFIYLQEYWERSWTGYQRCFQVSDRRSEWNKKERIFFWAILIIGMTAANIFSNAVISRISARINVMIQNEIQADILKRSYIQNGKNSKIFEAEIF